MTAIYKHDVVRSIELITGGKKSFKNLAHSLARSIVRMGIYRLDKNPGSDWPGDLARKIENRLAVNKEPPLSPTERVGAASYAQNLPELDTLCPSNRLKHLLAQDLELRRKGSSPKQGGSGQGQGQKGQGQSQGQGKKANKKKK